MSATIGSLVDKNLLTSPRSLVILKMMLMSGHEVLVNGEWVSVSKETWRASSNRRRCVVPRFGRVEYHGPCFEGEKASSVRRECRCSTCTLFEEGNEHTPAVARAVAAMM